jgi:hypothetical protein
VTKTTTPDYETDPRIDEFDLAVTSVGSDLRVSYVGCRQAILVGTDADVEALLAMLAEERDRIKAEIEEDVRLGIVAPGRVGDFGDLGNQVDENIYRAGARRVMDVAGRKRHEWNEAQGDAHVRKLIARGLIGKGIGPVDPDDIFSNESMAGFDNAAVEAVAVWLREGGLKAEAAPSPRR